MVARLGNLKVVERASFYKADVQLWSEDQKAELHSLHYSVTLPGMTRPEIPAYFIEKFSAKGDVVLDPFAGSGTTGLEANVQGRVSYVSDIDPLGIRLTQAKLEPADITDVTLRLQLVNLRRPIALQSFSDAFRPFYDVDTFRELVNLRATLSENPDRTNRFIELIATSLLHGHTAGFFSVYTFPQMSVGPEEQVALNLKRGQVPDHRAVVPRILRKTASVLRDGVSSVMRQTSAKNRYAQSDARNLQFVPSSSVDLVVTTPPLPIASSGLRDRWLKYWFTNIPTKGVPTFEISSLEQWIDFMNECLLELARVVRVGGRVVLDLRELRSGRESVLLDDLILADVQDNLSRYWDAEALFINTPQMVRLKNKDHDPEKSSQSNRLLVLKRR